MKYKILLIQPENKEINRVRRKQLNNFVQITMPYLAAFIDETLFDITLVDEYNQSVPFDRTFDLVAITVNTPNARHCYDMAERFRSKGAKIVMGGPHITLLPEEAAKHGDFLVVGEGERTWPVFLKDFVSGNAKKRYEDNEAPPLDGLPVPRWDLLHHRSSLMKGAVFATRGCPYHCRYCNLKQIYHNSFRTRPIDEVIREIKAVPSGYFVFWDDNFFADREYALAVMKAMKPLRKRWAAQATLRDCDDDELLGAAREAGCIYLFVGLESFSRASLADAGKPINRVGDYRAIIQKVYRYRILIQAGIVFGFDSDTKEVFADTLSACEALGIDGATVSILTPLPKTPIYEDLKRENRLKHSDWQFYNGKTYVAFEPKHMSAQELYEGYLWFRKRFYSLRSFIRRMRISRTRTGHNFLINLGYRLAIKKPRRGYRESISCRAWKSYAKDARTLEKRV